MKKALIFDLDNTLVVSKQVMTPRMASSVTKLLSSYDLLVISGSKWELFKHHIIDQLEESEHLMHRLHMMPVCGTSYYQFKDGDWNKIYSEDLTKKEIEEITNALEKSAKKLGHWEKKTWGDIIENRGSQVTFSALGQKAPPKEKYKWDPGHKKKQAIANHAQQRLPGFDVKVGGTTSIDVTKPGIDKAYGVKKFMDLHGHEKEHLLFFGDMLHEGGNDYPIKAMGIETIAVENPDHTLLVLEDYLG